MSLNERIARVRQQVQDLFDETEAILSVAEESKRDLTAEEQARITAIQGKGGDDLGEVGVKQAELRQLEAVQERQKKIAANRARQEGFGFDQPDEPKPVAKIPARVKTAKSKFFDDAEAAYQSGQFLLATVGGSSQARQWCVDHGVVAAHTTFENPKGGYLVPEPLEASIIRLVEERGNFRRNVRMWPLPNGSTTIPRRVGGFTSQFVGEFEKGDESELKFDQIKLEAKKLMVNTAVTTELTEDAIIALADLITLEIGLSFADKEDRCGFLGDGTSEFGGIKGLKHALLAGSVATAASAKKFDDLLFSDFQRAEAKLADFPGIVPKWYISRTGWVLSMQRLMAAAGGNAISDLATGAPPQFMGHPVEFVNVLSKETGDQDDETVAYFGDLGMAATMGTARGVTILSDSSVYFQQDAIAIKGTERFDINVHERGTATAGGPIIALKMAA